MTKSCKIVGCTELSGFNGTAKGLCRSHYKRYLRYGDPEVPLRKIASWKGHKCLHVGCDREPAALGLCEMHYAAKRRNKDPEGDLRRRRAFELRKEDKKVKIAGRPRAMQCELCGASGKTVFDHCHIKGHFRGWICDRCNKTLGIVRDDIFLLKKMISYLETNNG